MASAIRRIYALENITPAHPDPDARKTGGPAILTPCKRTP